MAEIFTVGQQSHCDEDQARLKANLCFILVIRQLSKSTQKKIGTHIPNMAICIMKYHSNPINDKMKECLSWTIYEEAG